ncbi:sensor histidine kinase [Eubacterium barkeri]|uniref:histidine kinase n=1 Tax=Eubacterium barkeri TaxID=1528 RepID=A0A1H3AEK9_EUBBA|nr:HAMP domain-containing sensor histidine kinase [Eubacterium barkeri]SDX28147.1 Histidine kinase-, DNA gyrase B-, and HSP90-like ATPase [Eubacterium barkeri]
MKGHSPFYLFWCDHFWLLFPFALGPLGVFFLYGTLLDASLLDFTYYCFLNLLILALFLLWRLYATWGYYQLISKLSQSGETETMDHYQLPYPHSHFEGQVSQLLGHLSALSHQEALRHHQSRKQQKLAMYRWVHQLKTPLSVIALTTEAHGKSADFSTISTAVRQIQYQLDQILDLYSLDAIENDFQSEPVDLRQLCKATINELKDAFITAHIFPKLTVPEGTVVYSDGKWLKLILYQLLTNAIKYSPPDQAVCIHGASSPGQVTLSVSDSGIGIPKADLPGIFDLFFCGSNGRATGESNGIGLYLASQTAAYLGHRLTVESTIGRGSTFSILFQNPDTTFEKMTEL